MEQSYKEKYEQALAKAKEQYNYPCMRSCMGILEEIFPELKESEDEKIRKELIKHLKEGAEGYELAGGSSDYQRWLAWLEKQGEKLPAGFYYVNSEGKKFYSEKFKYGNVVLGISANNGKDEQKPTDSYCQENCKGYQETGKCFADGGCDAKRKAEQKPEEDKGNIGGISPNWSEEEERYICQLESMVKERWTLAEKEQDEEVIKNMSNLAFFLKTLNPNKKPTDEEMKTLLRTEYEKGRADAIAEMQGKWSEEDEENFCSVYLDVKSARQNTVNSLSGDLKEQEEKRMDEVISWLESLKGRVQPKQEWNEEDSIRLQRIIDFLWYNRKGDTDTIYQQEQDIDWLKSLRPQNRWKPSETDIMILEKVFNGKIDPKDFQETLSNVLEQLKKLKKE